MFARFTHGQNDLWALDPVTFTDVERRSSTESWRWNDEIESAGRFSLRFCRYGGSSTATQITARIKSTKMVTLRAYLRTRGP